jgi:hypothetical protein
MDIQSIINKNEAEINRLQQEADKLRIANTQIIEGTCSYKVCVSLDQIGMNIDKTSPNSIAEALGLAIFAVKESGQRSPTSTIRYCVIGNDIVFEKEEMRENGSQMFA